MRIALHSGEALLRDPRNYAGPALNRCARLRGLAQGGQTLVSRATYELVADSLPEGAGLRALGPRRLRDLARAEEVFELTHPELPSGFPPPRSLDALPNNLPVQLSSFIGREAELREVGRLISDHRLLTLTGAGGCGKTRLAVQAASEALDRFPDGAWWVELAPLGDERLVDATIADALGVRPLPGVTELQACGAYLASRKALLVFDNCEHLAGACAAAAEALLAAAPESWSWPPAGPRSGWPGRPSGGCPRCRCRVRSRRRPRAWVLPTRWRCSSSGQPALGRGWR